MKGLQLASIPRDNQRVWATLLATAVCVASSSGAQSNVNHTGSTSFSESRDAGGLSSLDRPEPDGSSMSKNGLTAEWIIHLAAPTLSSPIIADVDNDGTKDIVISTYCPTAACPDSQYAEGRVFVFDMEGNNLPGWPRWDPNGPFAGSPVVGDIDNDGDMEVVAASWARIQVWDHQGTYYPGWPRYPGSSRSPTLADLDADGDLEILTASSDKRLHVRHHDGSDVPGWPFLWTGGTAFGYHLTPTVADLDGDGSLEIVAGTGQSPTTGEAFDFFVWQSDGSVRTGFPLTAGNQRVSSALGDLDSDGMVEIVFTDTGDADEGHVFVVDAFGNPRPGWPRQLDGIGNSTPALGDLDGDGEIDVVIAGAQGPDCDGYRINALDHSGNNLAGWPVDIEFTTGSCSFNSPAAIADIDGDGRPEVIAKNWNHVHAFHADGSPVAGFPFYLSDQYHSGTFAPGPAIDDMDNDGDLEFVFVSSYGSVAFFDEAAPARELGLQWPMYKQNPRGTGFLPPAGNVGDCAPDANTLCLPADDRFRVSVYYETVQGGGRMGDAQAIPLDTVGLHRGGIFYFVDSENPEFLVKVLDGCAINDHYWVFYAATTNVGFELTVVDTQTPFAVRTYTNPDVHPALTITDTRAFATCP